MASQQMFHAHSQNKGTLVPGQTITVNNYSVQVERYLSQGGFAHVYLVRTPAPVYNTTHHVLKRIAVANEAMLSEVKKEVDVMRLLKGHPNIVHLIDAAWHKLPNGTFEVFILMEYCPGGGIIDMMNRRLRERLTEAEILQIFVDVCEGVAYMHNSRPPLLHRDLKVENILQSSPTSYKLCDFGSATTVSPPPTTMQEIRALESDLNRHTTLQYRAPEMVDVYSKRPVNEKSDVWALGVLLFKLCYYTTPFEEHGPLAILNVQYRIPPYPVYSPDMNILIGSMLREHGAQRPSVFEILVHVHRLRGSKSKFNYTIPVSPPLVPPRSSQPSHKPTHPLDGLVSYGQQAKQPMSLYGSSVASAMSNPGTQAREKVLEAIAPMRRGRPTSSREGNISRSGSPHRPPPQDTTRNWMDTSFGVEQDKAWQAATQKTNTPTKSKDDVWTLVDTSTTPSKSDRPRPTGFNDDFSQNLWSTSSPNSTLSLKPSPSPQPLATSAPPKASESPSITTPLAFTGSRMLRPKQDRIVPASKSRDAFDGLGLMTSAKPSPTLGEARKLRTGLASMGNHSQQSAYLRPKPADDRSNSTSPQASPSPQPHYLSAAPIQGKSLSPLPTPSNGLGGKPPPHVASASANLGSSQVDGMPIESRFPSLEELDSQFGSSASSLYPSYVGSYSSHTSAKSTDARPSQFISRPSQFGSSPKITAANSGYANDVGRSEHASAPVREMKENLNPETRIPDHKASVLDRTITSTSITGSPIFMSPTARRPSLVRKHRSSMAMSPHLAAAAESEKTSEASYSLETPKLPPRPGSHSPSKPPRDWLTGVDHEEELPKTHTPADLPILRDSPSKRASYIAQTDFTLPSAFTAQRGYTSKNFVDEPESDISPTVSTFKKAFPDVEKLDTEANATVLRSGFGDDWGPVRKSTEPESSSGEEGPEDAGASGSVTRAIVEKRANPTRHKGRQSSVHDLVNQYGGAYTPSREAKEQEKAPTARAGLGDYVPKKTQVTGGSLAPPASRQDTDRKTPSPTSNTYKIAVAGLSPPPKAARRQQTGNSSQPSKPQAPPVSSKPVSTGGRSRPQSMFIFPSKMTEPPASASTSTAAVAPSDNLVPPEDTTKATRTARRTSISDMVQKYEAIGGRRTPTKTPGPPSPVHRPISIKSGSSQENGRKPVGDRLGSPVKSRTNTLDNQNIGLGSSPASKVNRNRIVSDNQKPMLAPGTSENIATRVRKLSVKNEPMLISSSSRVDPLAAARAVKVSAPQDTSTTIIPQPSRSPRKSTIPLAQSADVEPPRTPVEADKPYQGVGKLIDQWQKKSAGAEQPRSLTPAKRNFPPKKVGAVHGDG